MKFNSVLFKLLDKYVSWAKFDWCLLIINYLDKMYCYDMEEHKKRSISYLIKCMIDNGMLNECFTQKELKDLYEAIPKRFKKEIYYYVTDTRI